MKVTAILKGRKDDLGRQNIVIRISEGQNRTYKKLGIKIPKEQFSSGLVRSSHPLHKSYNIKIKEELLKIEKAGKFTDQKEGILFSDYFDQLIERWHKTKRPETIRQLTSEKNKFNNFDAGARLTDFTPAYLQKYKEYCFNLGNKENTVWKSFKAIRTIILRAWKEGQIKDNPFPLFEMPRYRDPKKVWLTDEEVKAIEETLSKPLPPEILFTARWFLIGCYTGLRFGDMAAFNKKEHIKQGRLILYTSKTGEVVSIPIKERVKQLLEAVNYKGLSFTNAHYNRLLKQVGQLAEVDTVLTGHLSRHTAAIRWANHGVSQEVVAKLLGHTNLKTTAIYFKITGSRIDKELPE